MYIIYKIFRIDIMGNVIYLMAANSKRKSHKWAVPMAHLFWAYRVLISWILLITVTIYASADVNTGSDVLNNEDVETRYEQTYKNPAGLSLFIYTWITQIIWQWIGAVVVFDYKNLASVGRDIETLLDDGKWAEALELISFGAKFNAANVLQTIEKEFLPKGTPQEQLAIICKERIDNNVKDEENEKSVNKVCELLCSCPTFLAFAGLCLLIFGIVNTATEGTEDANFYFSVGAIVITNVF